MVLVITAVVVFTSGAVWGKTVTAEDVAFSFNYIIKNELGSLTQYTSPVTGVKVLDDVTVEMKLSEPINRDWLEKNTFCWIPILPKHIWADISKEPAVGSLPLEKLFGSGPYSEFEPDHFIRLTATEDAKKRFKPAFDEIIIKQYANDSAMLQNFKAGNIPKGWPFNPRCPEQKERCMQLAPELFDVGGQRQVACFSAAKAATSS